MIAENIYTNNEMISLLSVQKYNNIPINGATTEKKRTAALFSQSITNITEIVKTSQNTKSSICTVIML
jgi:hypothetical protein